VLYRVEPDELFHLRQDFIRDFLHRRTESTPEGLLPFAERGARIAARFLEEREAAKAMVRDWTAEARRQGWVVSDDTLHIGVPSGFSKREAREALKQYARDLGYRTVKDLVEARLMEPAVEWARRRKAMLEGFKDGLRDVQDA
jgi:hypothetical protein